MSEMAGSRANMEQNKYNKNLENMQNESDKCFKCEVCDFCSKSEITLRKHKITKYQESQENTDHLKCSTCHDKLRTVKEYNKHIEEQLE